MLARLVKLRNDVSDFVNETSIDSIDTVINTNVNILNSLSSDLAGPELNAIVDRYLELNNTNKNINDDLLNLITKLNNDIEKQSTLLIQDQEYQNKFNEKNIMSSDQKDIINIDSIFSKLSLYSNWKFPGLQIYPKNKIWIDYMVANDPLYLITENLDTISGYSPLYQQRLRVYKDINLLPKNQFGFIFAWQVLNYLSFDHFHSYLTRIFNLLRPGGVFMFSYNNCDKEAIANMAENKFISYVNNNQLKTVCDQIGYEIICFIDKETDDFVIPWESWAEIRKPGQLATIKAHQALATIG